MDDPIEAGDRRVAVMDVGGGHATGAVVTVAPDHVAVVQRADEPLDSSGTADAVLDTLERAARGAGPAEQWTIAMPGPFDELRGVGDYTGMGKFEALTGLDLGVALAARLGVPSAAIRFCNDAVAYGTGEWAQGAGDRAARMVCLTLGTGIGSAFLVDGRRVAQGDDVPPGGEAHRIVYQGRPLEDHVSTAAIRRAYAERAGLGVDGAVPAVVEVFRRARDGDADAGAVVGSTMRTLGRALGPWISRFGASVTVVGGAMAQSWDLVGPGVAAGLADVHADTDLRAARLLDAAPLVGAAVIATRPGG